MMGKQTTQIQMVILDLDSMIPKNHLLRLYIPTTELYLHGLLDPVSRRMRPTLTETEPFS